MWLFSTSMNDSTKRSLEEHSRLTKCYCKKQSEKDWLWKIIRKIFWLEAKKSYGSQN